MTNVIIVKAEKFSTVESIVGRRKVEPKENNTQRRVKLSLFSEQNDTYERIEYNRTNALRNVLA